MVFEKVETYEKKIFNEIKSSCYENKTHLSQISIRSQCILMLASDCWGQDSLSTITGNTGISGGDESQNCDELKFNRKLCALDI